MTLTYGCGANRLTLGVYMFEKEWSADAEQLYLQLQQSLLQAHGAPTFELADIRSTHWLVDDMEVNLMLVLGSKGRGGTVRLGYEPHVASPNDTAPIQTKPRDPSAERSSLLNSLALRLQSSRSAPPGQLIFPSTADDLTLLKGLTRRELTDELGEPNACEYGPAPAKCGEARRLEYFFYPARLENGHVLIIHLDSSERVIGAEWDDRW